MAVLRKVTVNNVDYFVNVSASTEYKYVAEFGEDLGDLAKVRDENILRIKSIKLCYICLKYGKNETINTDSFDDFLDNIGFVELHEITAKVLEVYFNSTKPVNPQKVEHSKKRKKGR